MDIKGYLADKKEIVDRALDKVLPSEDTYPEVLHKSMRHTIFAGGKRLRPILMIAVAELLGKDPKELLPLCCAFEMNHTALLILDDLPCMDDAKLRRGEKCSHLLYGEENAILGALGLVYKSFELVDGAAAKELALCLGDNGVTAGQTVDLLEANNKVDEETLKYIHNNKTGALFVGAIKAAATHCNASQEELDALLEYAKNLGFMFQIKDDLLDVQSDVKTLGKDTQKDADKTTFVSLYGAEKSVEKMKEYMWDAIKALRIFEGRAEILADIARFVVERRS